MSEIDRTSRQLIDDSGGMPFGKARLRTLREVLRRQGGAGPDDVEARAVALALLAQQDAAYLAEADAALREAARRGVDVDWILAHLAEAWLAVERPEEAFRCASSVNKAFFDSRDLHWRSVRMDEIKAAALLAMGRFDEGEPLALTVCGELARRGDEDDLVPPVYLVRAALALTADPAAPGGTTGCAVLHTLATSIEIDVWFPAELVGQIGGVLLECGKRQ